MRQLLQVCALGALASLALTSCSSPAANTRPDGDEAEGSAADLLDEPVDNEHLEAAAAARKAKLAEEAGSDYLVPRAPSELSVEIDGDPSGWNLREAKVFKDKRYVEDGVAFWSGNKDASMRVAVKADQGFFYMWVEVRDDVVISEDDGDGDAVDGVVIWLRDPRLEKMVSQLPESVDVKDVVNTEVAFLVTPDGRLRRYDDSTGSFDAQALRTRTFDTPKGWGVEAAISVEALEHVATLPTESIAFRVELHDGDDPERLGTQTRMSMLPDTKNAAVRFAVFRSPGLLPHRPTEGVGGRPDGLGFWELADAEWTYESFEVLPEVWRFVKEPTALEKALSESDELRDACPDARFDRRLLESYRTESGKHYVGLYLCAGRSTGSRCPSGANTRALWFQTAGADDDFELKKVVEAFDGPLEQCEESSPAGKPLYEKFSLTPLDFVNAHTWAVSWQRTKSSGGEEEFVEGMQILNTKKKGVKPLEVQSFKQISAGSERLVHKTAIYFVDIDDTDGIDICEIERIEEQTCRGSECRVEERGKEVLSHAKMWVPESARFEQYMLTRHPRCKADTDFTQTEGYLLLHLGDRVGLLPSGAE